MTGDGLKEVLVVTSEDFHIVQVCTKPGVVFFREVAGGAALFFPASLRVCVSSLRIAPFPYALTFRPLHPTRKIRRPAEIAARELSLAAFRRSTGLPVPP